MLTFPDLRDLDLGVISRDARKWQELATGIAERGNDLDRHLATLAEWHGPAADVAKANLGEQRKKLGDAATELGKIPPIFTDAFTRLDKAKQKLREPMLRAEENGLRIQPDGTVVVAATRPAPPGRVPTPPPLPGEPAPAGQPDQAQLAREITEAIQAALREATAADEEAAAAVRRLAAEATGFAPAAGDSTVAASATPIPPQGTSPADVKKWWDSLNDQQRESLLYTHGAQIGSMDGIPADVRDRANRGVLADQRAKLDEERARLETLPYRTAEQDQQLADIRGKLNGMQAIEDRLRTVPSAAQPQPYLLKIDPAGNGKAIVAMGNPDTAANVATYVPGTGSGLKGDSFRGDLERSNKMVLAAKNAGSPSTSVITWVGYDAPQTLPDASQKDYADNAKKDLDRFQDGLRATHDGQPSHNTMVGHSYGSTVIGHAARDESLAVDDLVFVGSPGVGVSDARNLHLDGVNPDDVGKRVHSSIAQYDPIKIATGLVHGPSPTSTSFGGTTFTSNPGQPGPWYFGSWNLDVHSEYWTDGNKSLINMGNVIAGKPTF